MSTNRSDNSSQSIAAVARALRRRYGDFAHYNRCDAIEELVFIICSVQTGEDRYRKTFAGIKSRYPTRGALSRATHKTLAKLIGPAGLSNQKARALRTAFDIIISRFGRLTLSPLRRWTDAECEAFLTSLPFVGKKVARCIMMCSLGRFVFPVDTHCWRIAKRLGWIMPTRRDGTCSQGDMDALQDLIPPQYRFSLHVNMVSLGRDICKAAKPRCHDCPLAKLCPTLCAQLGTPAPGSPATRSS